MLIAKDSVLRNVPTSVETRTILFLDGIRYSIEISHLAYLRLVDTLERVAALSGTASDELADLIVTSVSDAWAMIDSVHRLRELVEHLPGLRRKDPNVQVLLRSTEVVEELRNRVQHFRSEIDDFLPAKAPLWGSISWGRVSADTGRPQSHTIVPGTFFHEAGVALCTFDHATGRFEERLAVDVANKRIDLAAIHERVLEFTDWFERWFADTQKANGHHQSDLHLEVGVDLRPRSVTDP